ENVQPAEDANQEIQLLDSLDTGKTAVVNKDFISKIPAEKIERDSTAFIDLIEYKPNELIYEASTSTSQLAIFSEIYYPLGWNANIKDEPAEYFRANYALRAMVIPPGNNRIVFKFEPKVIQTGSTISLISFIVLILIFGGSVFYSVKTKNNLDSQEELNENL